MTQEAVIEEVVHRHAKAIVTMDIGQIMSDLMPDAMMKLQQEAGGGHASPEAAENVLIRERRERVRNELENLPAEQREVLELAFFQGLSQSEIAGRTGIPLGTVKTRSLLAMKKLRQALRPAIRELL